RIFHSRAGRRRSPAGPSRPSPPAIRGSHGSRPARRGGTGRAASPRPPPRRRSGTRFGSRGTERSPRSSSCLVLPWKLEPFSPVERAGLTQSDRKVLDMRFPLLIALVLILIGVTV